MSIMNIYKIKKIVQDHTKKYETTIDKYGKLLYLSLSGSILHGTNTENSDYDVKGIFLPHKEDLLCGRHKKVIHIDDKCENGIDINFELWSLQYITYLLKKGDSNIIDLLFSQTYPEAIIVDNNFTQKFNLNFIKNHILYDNMTGIVGYCLAQAEKYDAKIQTLSQLHKILNHISKFNVTEDTRLADIITKDIPTDEHTYIKKNNQIMFYYVYGKAYQSTIKVDYFKIQINKRIQQYGNRVHNAFDFHDFKSLAHSYRASLEYYEILTTGSLQFPLKDKEKLLDIKRGREPYDTTITKIKTMINKITKIDKGNIFNKTEPNIDEIENIIRSYYN
jgi:predicted nucleotidyltransferase